MNEKKKLNLEDLKENIEYCHKKNKDSSAKSFKIKIFIMIMSCIA